MRSRKRPSDPVRRRGDAGRAALRLALVIVFGATLVSCGTAAGGATYYLSPEGDDQSSGGREAPWASLERASRSLRAGDTLVLAPGSYGGVFRLARRGRPGAPITVRAAERRSAKLIGEAGEPYAVVLHGVSHVRLEGLHIKPELTPEEAKNAQPVVHPHNGFYAAPALEGRGWISITRSHDIHIEDCQAEKAIIDQRGIRHHPPLRIYNSDQIFLRDSDIREFVGRNMIQIGHSSHVLLEGNAIGPTGHSPLQFYPIGTNRNVAIRGNVFHPGWGRAFELFSVENVLFENNLHTDAFNGGRSASAASKIYGDGLIYRFNQVFRNWGLALNSAPYRRDIVFRDVRIYNNVYVNNTKHAHQIRADRQNVANVRIVNDVYAGNDPHGAMRQLDIIGSGRILRLSRNVIFGSPGRRGRIFVDKKPYRLAELQSPGKKRGHGVFSGNLDVKPGFVAPERGDFSLTGESPLRDSGLALTRAKGAGTGSKLPVEDASWFYDGFGIAGERGDVIAIGKGQEAQVVQVNGNEHELLLDRSVTWEQGDPVSLPWSGQAPDIGVYEHGSDGRPSVQVLVDPFRAKPGQRVEMRAVLRGIEEPVSVEWQLGDGSIASGANITHRYDQAKSQPVRVTVRDEAEGLHRGVGYVLADEEREPGSPLVHHTFDADDDTWWWHWKLDRPNPDDWHRTVDPETGNGILTVSAPRDEGYGPMSAAIHPREWRLDRDPIIEVRYRIKKRSPIALYVSGFETRKPREFVLAATPAASEHLRKPAREQLRTLLDDGEWHHLVLDVRGARELYPDLDYLEGLAFRAPDPKRAQPEDRYQLDEVIIHGGRQSSSH